MNSRVKIGIGIIVLFVGIVAVISLPSRGFAEGRSENSSLVMKLTPAERKLVDAVARGEVASFLTGDSVHDDPIHGSGWGEQRTLRATVIMDLVTRANSARKVRSAGVIVLGARIVGELNFENAHLQFPLGLEHCFIYEPIRLFRAWSQAISLAGSYIAGTVGGGQTVFPEDRISVLADGIRTDGNLILNSGFGGKGAIRLAQARIDGLLDCSHSTIVNPGGYAIDASEAHISDDVFLNNLKAKGGVSFVEARVGGNLVATGTTIDNLDGFALAASGAAIDGNVSLNFDFTADGKCPLKARRLRETWIVEREPFAPAKMVRRLY